MSTRREGDDFRKLRRLGFKLNEPQDTLSEQPASSGRMDGPLGEEEFGIEGGSVEESSKGRELQNGPLSRLEDEQKMASLIGDKFGGISHWSIAHGISEEESLDEISGVSPAGELTQLSPNAPRNDDELLNDLRTKLATHKELDLSHVDLSVKNGVVTADGDVSAESARIRLDEIFQAIPEVRRFENHLRVSPG